MFKLYSFFLVLAFALGNLFKFSIISPDIKFSLLDLAVFLGVIASWKKIYASEHYLKNPVIIFSLWSLTSLFFSLDRYGSAPFLVGLFYWLRWTVYSLGFLVLSKTRSLLLILGLTTVFLGAFQYSFYPDTRGLEFAEWDPHYYRLIGTFLDPGFTGLIIVFTIILLTVLPVKNWLVNSFFWSASFISLMLTYSRSSYLAFLVGMTYISWKRKSWAFLSLTVIVFVIALSLLPRPGGEGVKLERTNSIAARIISWKNSLTIIRDYPIIGVGFNVYRYAQKDYGLLTETNWLINHAGAGADSSLLFTIATTGLVGVVAYTWYLNNLNRSSITSYFLLPLLFHSLFLNSLYYPAIMLWLALSVPMESKSQPSLF